MTKMYEFLQRELKSGEVGIEIEMESKHSDGIEAISNTVWTTVADHSLRGHGMEYILRRPLSFKSAVKAVNSIYHKFEEMDLTPSINAGIHFHLNILGLEQVQFNNLLKLLILMESKILDSTHPSRHCNNFCLPFSHSVASLQNIKMFVSSPRTNFRAINREGYKYQNINLYSITQHGSIEIRCFESTTDKNKVQGWLAVLSNIYNLALTVDFKIEDVPSYFSHVFGEDCFKNYSSLCREIFIIEEIFNA